MKKFRDVIAGYGKATQLKDCDGTVLKIGDIVRADKVSGSAYYLILAVNQKLPTSYFTGDTYSDPRLGIENDPIYRGIQYRKIATAMQRADLVYECVNLGQLLHNFMMEA